MAERAHTQELPVNHHAAYRGCTGVPGVLPGLAMLLFGRPAARLVVDLAELSAGNRVVDLGCGPGNAVRRAARAGARVTGVEPSAEILRIARAVTRDRADIRWIHARAEDIPVPDAAASVPVDGRPGASLDRRRSRPGPGVSGAAPRRSPAGHRAPGRGLVSHGWTARQARSFAELCRAAGFTDVSSEERAYGRRTAAVVQAVRSMAGVDGSADAGKPRAAG